MIGTISLSNATQPNIFLSIQYTIYGFALDAHFKRRRLYWSTPQSTPINRGAIYYADIDAINPMAYTLTSVSGGSNFILDPHGLAIHYIQNRLFWVSIYSIYIHQLSITYI